MKINKLEIENVKRVKAVKMEPSASGLTIIGGDNNQGKTSVLDAIAWALGGNAFRPSEATRQGSTIPPYLRIVMSNGIVVERKGKNSDLKVTDPTGRKGGQQLLDSFVEKLALDLPKFMEANDSDKAKILLNIIGVGNQLKQLEDDEKRIYNDRTVVGRIADQKQKFAQEQPYYPDAPKDIVSAAELIRQQQEILARNGEKQRLIHEHDIILGQLEEADRSIERIRKELHAALSLKSDLEVKLKASERTPRELEMESTEELERNIAEVDEINRKVRANLDKDKAEEDAQAYVRQYAELTDKLEGIRQQKRSLLDHADLPLPELTVSDGVLLYKGQRWDNMSGSDRLIVATSIVRRLNPECGFVLMDKLEQMDMKTLKAFGAWLEEQGLQVIATRVSTGEECSIIIEDGYGTMPEAQAPVPARAWKKGEF